MIFPKLFQTAKDILTIEVHLLKGDDEHPYAHMEYIDPKEFKRMATRLTTSAPFNLRRYERLDAIRVRLTYADGSRYDHYTEKMTTVMAFECLYYKKVYELAEKAVDSRRGLFIRKLSGYRRKVAILQALGKAREVYDKTQYLVQ